MIRTQIYLSELQKKALERMSAAQGVSMAELIRRAIDRLLEEGRIAYFEDVLEATFGLWKDREDIQDSQAYVRKIRQEWQAREVQ